MTIANKIIAKDGDLKAAGAFFKKKIVSNPIKVHFTRGQLAGYTLASSG